MEFDLDVIRKRDETAKLSICQFINLLQNLSGKRGYADIVKHIEYLHYCNIMEQGGDIPNYIFLKKNPDYI